VELLERVAQQRVVGAVERVDAGEDERLGRLVAGQRLRRGVRGGGERVADLAVAHALEAGGHVAHFAGHELPDRHELRPEDAQLEQVGLGARGHEPDRVVLPERARGQADVGHDALVGVVMGVEDEAAQGGGRVALGGRDAGHDGLEDLGDAGAFLGRGEQDLLARDGQDVLQFLDHEVRLGRGQVDLVDDGHDDQPLGQRQVHVGERLGLDALGRIHHQHRSLAGLQAAADLVGEVDVAGRVDQVQAVVQAVSCLVVEANGAGLDGDAVLALEVHRVEHLARHLSRLDRVRQLQEAVGQGGLAVIDVGDDREVAQARLGDHGEPEYIGYEWVPQDLGPVGWTDRTGAWWDTIDGQAARLVDVRVREYMWPPPAT